MSERVRGGSIRERKPSPEFLHTPLDDPCTQTTAALSDEQGVVRVTLRRCSQILVDAVPHRDQQRHHALLVALAMYAKHVAVMGDVGPVERECLVDPEPGTVQEQEDRLVAEAFPPGLYGCAGVDDRLHLTHAERFGSPLGHTRGPQLSEACPPEPMMPGEVEEKTLHAGACPGDAGRRHRLRRAHQLCQPGPIVGRR